MLRAERHAKVRENIINPMLKGSNLSHKNTRDVIKKEDKNNEFFLPKEKTKPIAPKRREIIPILPSVPTNANSLKNSARIGVGIFCHKNNGPYAKNELRKINDVTRTLTNKEKRSASPSIPEIFLRSIPTITKKTITAKIQKMERNEIKGRRKDNATNK